MLEGLREFYAIKINIGSMFLFSSFSLVGGFILGFLAGREK